MVLTSGLTDLELRDALADAVETAADGLPVYRDRGAPASPPIAGYIHVSLDSSGGDPLTVGDRRYGQVRQTYLDVAVYRELGVEDSDLYARSAAIRSAVLDLRLSGVEFLGDSTKPLPLDDDMAGRYSALLWKARIRRTTEETRP